MRISLKYLLGVFVFFSVILWCAAQVGFDNGVFWVAAIVSTAMSFLFVLLALQETGRWLTFIFPISSAFFIGVPFFFFSQTLLVNAFLLSLVGMYCAYKPPLRLATLSIVVMLCAAISFVSGVLPGQEDARQLRALRNTYPTISLEDRLQYEQSTDRSNRIEKVVLSSDAMESLKETEQELSQNSFMEYQFRRIHDHQYELFLLARGFGIGRMPRPSLDYLKRPPLDDIPFDTKLVEEEEVKSNDWSGVLSISTSDAIEHLHKASRYDFLDAESFGVVLEPQAQVVGFVEHGFHHSPDQSLKDGNAWVIERLELVSLLKFDEPRVYVLDHLPRMDQLSSDDVPTRSLDEFEAGALQQLQTEKDIIATNKNSEYRMLGSLRAAKQCLECHNVSRGELLGAFSYDLRLASKEVSTE